MEKEVSGLAAQEMKLRFMRIGCKYRSYIRQSCNEDEFCST